MPAITNKEEWWEAVDYYWIDLCGIVYNKIDCMHPAYAEVGNDKSPETGLNIMEELLQLKNNKDPKLARYFAAAWDMASEAYCYSVPSWGVLCDLLSEEHVLYEEIK